MCEATPITYKTSKKKKKKKPKTKNNETWGMGYISAIPALGRLGQEDLKFKASLDCRVSSTPKLSDQTRTLWWLRTRPPKKGH
jgi:hypothetical protein